MEVALLGALLVLFGFVSYPVIAAMTLNMGIASELLVVDYAYFALALDLLGLCLLFFGGTNVLTSWSSVETSKAEPSVLGTMSTISAKSRYSQILLASAFVYGAFYAFASGIVVFQPAFSFSASYHVGIPSVVIATCCGSIGETPQFVAYLSQHLGLLFVPVNLLLLFSISWLVGLNASFASFALKFRTRGASMGWFGGIGALLGLFVSCPTCAGLAIISLLGGTGILSASFFLGPLQTVLVLVSVPVLIVTPLLSARSLRNLEGRACALS